MTRVNGDVIYMDGCKREWEEANGVEREGGQREREEKKVDGQGWIGEPLGNHVFFPS